MTRPPSAWTIQTVMSTVMAMASRLEAAGMTDKEELFAALREETPDLEAILLRLVRAEGEASADAEALRSRIADLEVRKKRAERMRDECRATLFSALDALGLTKWVHAEATVTISDGKMQAVVTDPLQLPSEYATVTVKPNMALINKALAAGEEVPGVEARNGAPVLTIRTK